jgi:type IV secretory pathway ATPase VirB11/archaellum biosynthesis ATPase
MSDDNSENGLSKAYRFEDVRIVDFINVLGGVSGGKKGFKRRWGRMVNEREVVGRNIRDLYLPASMFVIGFILLLVGSLSSDSSFIGLYLGESSVLGDFLLFHSLLVSIICFYLAFNRWDLDRGGFARNVGFGLQLVPFIFGIVMVSGLFTDFVITNSLGGLYSIFSPVASTGVFTSYIGSGPFVSVGFVGMFMFFSGAIFSLVHLGLVSKAAVRAANSNYEKMPDPSDIIERDVYNLVSFDKESDIYSNMDSELDNLFDIPSSMKLDIYDGFNEINRYWLKVPYSYAVILEDDEENDLRYHVVEPELDSDREKFIMDEFHRRLENKLPMEDIDPNMDYNDRSEEKVKILERSIVNIATEYNISFENTTFHKILYYIKRDQVDWGEIDPLMSDDNIEDISCNGSNVPVYVFHREYKDLETNIGFNKQDLKSYIIQLAQRSGEHISRANPEIDASLPDGSRVQLSLSEDVTPRGPAFTIRRFEEIPFTPVDLIRTGTFSIEQMTYLWMGIEYGRSLMFAGGTASGKTTSMNAVSLFIPPKSKIVSIEDTRELRLPHQNWVPSITREAFISTDTSSENSITEFDLLKTALRRRPEYLIVGEIRGEEARTLFQAMNTGHTTYSTMHADSIDSAIDRLENPPLNVPTRMIRALDIMCIQKQVRINDQEGGSDNQRRNEKIIELRSGGSGDITTDTRFQWDPETDEFRSGSFVRDSKVMQDIKKQEGWDNKRLEKEVSMRKEVLNYLLDNNIEDVRKVTRTIQSFISNKDETIKQIRSGSFDANKLKSLTSSSFDHKEGISDVDKLKDKINGDNNE